MLILHRTEWRRQHRPGRSGYTKGGTGIAFGEFGIQTLEGVYLANRQIEAARIAVTRRVKRSGKTWINIFPDRPLIKKPAETRMGSNKGSIGWWVTPVRLGCILLEIGGVSEKFTHEALSRTQHKLPIKTRSITREGGE